MGKIKIMREENLSDYSENIIKVARNLKYFGRMTDSTSGASIKGPCGDEMEFYLVIKDGIIEDVKFYTDGCIATKVCGSMTAQLAFGKSIKDALRISPQQVIESLKGFLKTIVTVLSWPSALCIELLPIICLKVKILLVKPICSHFHP